MGLIIFDHHNIFYGFIYAQSCEEDHITLTMLENINIDFAICMQSGWPNLRIPKQYLYPKSPHRFAWSLQLNTCATIKNADWNWTWLFKTKGKIKLMIIKKWTVLICLTSLRLSWRFYDGLVTAVHFGVGFDLRGKNHIFNHSSWFRNVTTKCIPSRDQCKFQRDCRMDFLIGCLSISLISWIKASSHHLTLFSRRTWDASYLFLCMFVITLTKNHLNNVIYWFFLNFFSLLKLWLLIIDNYRLPAFHFDTIHYWILDMTCWRMQ